MERERVLRHDRALPGAIEDESGRRYAWLDQSPLSEEARDASSHEAADSAKAQRLAKARANAPGLPASRSRTAAPCR